MNKRLIAVGAVCLLLAAGAAVAVKNNYFNTLLHTGEQEETAEQESYEEAVSKEADLIFWYDEKSYEAFFLSAAKSYYEKSGTAVAVRYRDSLDYLGDIYQGTIQEEECPDLYLLSGEQLEEAYLLGLAKENKEADYYRSVLTQNAVSASSFRDKMIGYPLSYNVCLFAYHNVYFESVPASIQDVIDFSNENEPPENVKYLLEWDVNDPFYDFPFVSEGVSFSEKTGEGFQVQYNEALYTEELAFLETSLESFSIDMETISEESVRNDLLEGATLCAIIDSDSLGSLRDCGYSFTEMPRLNDTLEAVSAALTDMVIVNDFTKEAEEAEKFAVYLTDDMLPALYGATDHYPIRMSEQPDALERTAFSAYEHAVLAPASSDALEFWVALKEKVAEFF